VTGGRLTRIECLVLGMIASVLWLVLLPSAVGAMPAGRASNLTQRARRGDNPTGRIDPIADITKARGGGALHSFSIAMERGLAVNRKRFSQQVTDVLFDRRSWIGTHEVALRRIPAGGDFTIMLASPRTTDRRCSPLDTEGRYSCRHGRFVVLNVWRWRHGAKAFDSLTRYRAYLINHEVGHALGRSHEPCSGPGRPAPVMMPQTEGVGRCRSNSWPLAWEKRAL
jgi:hypothetical protein